MEKLQAAIDAARKNRASGAAAPRASETAQREVETETPPKTRPAQHSSAPRARPRGPSGSSDAEWNKLGRLDTQMPHLLRNRIVAASGGADAAPYDMLRTRIVGQMKKEGWKRMIVTSPGKACGKSTTCANLAFSLSRQSDVRTIVFETDFRRPSMAKMLGQRHSQSFHDVLEGQVDFADQALRLSENVAISLTHDIARDPSEILQSNRTSEILDEIEARFQPDLMIFDMPPLLANDDSLGFVKNVDCALLIALAEKSTVEDVDVCERELGENTNVLGVILNRCRYQSATYGYAYDY